MNTLQVVNCVVCVLCKDGAAIEERALECIDGWKALENQKREDEKRAKMQDLIDVLLLRLASHTSSQDYESRSIITKLKKKN